MAKTIKSLLEIFAVFTITFIVYSAFFLVPTSITGMSIAGDLTTGTEMVYENGSTAVLEYDNLSKAYHDLSYRNPNIKLKLCSDVAGATDFNNKYFALYYIQDSTNKIKLSIQPTQVTASTPRTSNCVYQDIDISPMTSFYPGIPQVLMSTDPDFAYYDSWNLTNTTGYLKGSFNLTISKNVDYTYITISNIYDEQGNEITESWPYLLVSVKNETGNISFNQLTQPKIQLVAPSTSENFSIFVNNYEYEISQKPEICDNGIDDDGNGLIDCDDPACFNFPGCVASAPVSLSGGGSSGGSRTYCQFKWECTPWSKCQIDGFQYRNCIDLNKCYDKINIRRTYLAQNIEGFPDTIKKCNYIPSCNDGVRNGKESDTDCGGNECIGCEEGQFCNKNNDCLSENCKENRCYPPDVHCLTDRDCPKAYTCINSKCERTPFVAELDFVPLPDNEKVRLFGIGIIVSLAFSMVFFLVSKKIGIVLAGITKFFGDKGSDFKGFLDKEYENLKEKFVREKVPTKPLKEKTIEDVHQETINRDLNKIKTDNKKDFIKKEQIIEKKKPNKTYNQFKKKTFNEKEALHEKTIYDKEMDMIKKEISKIKKKRK